MSSYDPDVCSRCQGDGRMHDRCPNDGTCSHVDCDDPCPKCGGTGAGDE